MNIETSSFNLCRNTFSMMLITSLFSNDIITKISPFVYAFIMLINHGKGNQGIPKNTRSMYLFIYLGFYITFNTVQVISRWVVGRVEETSTYSLSGFCTVNCRPAASNQTSASEVGVESLNYLMLIIHGKGHQ